MKAWVKIPRWLPTALALALAACDVPADPEDGGGARGPDAAQSDAGATTCRSDEECADPTVCNGVEYCDPASAAADARGCVPGAPPCREGEVCDEATDACTIDCPVAPDGDGDGHVSVECGGDDCADHDADRFPGGVEICDAVGHDEDCNPATFGFVDADGDGTASSACCNVQDDGSLLCGGDCDDADSTVYPAAGDGPPLFCDGVDNDCDGERDEACPCVEGDEEACGTDVQLMRIGICSPGRRFCVGGAFTTCSGGVDPAAEICNALDDDCDGTVDEAVQRTYYADGDGFGVAGTTTLACSPPPGWSASSGDCDDAVASASPAAPDLCNGRDDDCDGSVDEGVTTRFHRDADGDGFGDAAMPVEACARPAGHVVDSTDCDDTRGAVSPAALELCDGRDNDCDGGVDPGCACTDGTTMACGSSATGECALGTQRCIGGSWGECVGAVAPRTETCNELDDDCDGATDEGVTTTFHRDADGDGFGAPGVTTAACAPPAGYVRTPTDCDDTSAGVNPAQLERCNGADDNCASGIDEGCSCLDGATEACGTSDGAGGVLEEGECAAGLRLCVAGTWGGCVGSIAPQPESCNGRDDDCDATADEGVTTTYFRDADGDGFGAPGATASACAPPAGYVATSTDCDDTDAAISPGQAERCNGVDDDCGGGVDEGCECTDGASRACGTADGAGGFVTEGECAAGLQQCVAGGWGSCIGAVAPRAEGCNGLDDDCDAAIDETTTASCHRDGDGDGFGTGALVEVCASAGGACPPGYAAIPGDCNDGVASIGPGASEVCNGANDDCDGAIDEGTTTSCREDRDGDGWGFGPTVQLCPCAAPDCTFACPAGYSGRSGAADCDDGNLAIHPTGAEVCNGADDDCDGGVDEAVRIACYEDRDADAYGFGPSLSICPAAGGGCPTGYAIATGDCNDYDALIHPGATERCNGVSDDCDATIDSDHPAYECAQGTTELGTTACGTSGRRDCDASCEWVSSQFLATYETCNYCDDNGASGLADEQPSATSTSTRSFWSCSSLQRDSVACSNDSLGDGTLTVVSFATSDVGAAVLSTPVRIGYGPLEVRVRVEASAPASGDPADGWALVAYLHDRPGDASPPVSTPIAGLPGAALGVSDARDGYAAEWFYYTPPWFGGSPDRVALRALSASGADPHVFAGAEYAAPPSAEHLDAGSGTRTQRLTLYIHPDLPHTAENEGTVEVRSSSGAVLRACYGGATLPGCPFHFLPGDLVQVGLTAATGGAVSRVVVRGDLVAVLSGVSATSSSLCP